MAILTDTAEREYTLSVSHEHRKQFAQFFTPPAIASVMARWVAGAARLDTVLEPAFGLGVFTRALHAIRPGATVTGYDTDSVVAEWAGRLFASDERVAVRLSDYMASPWEARYDGILCNPPYFKFHDYDNHAALAEVERHTGHRLTGFTNLYALFLLKSLWQLSEGGRCAYIVPSEFLNADYGTEVKRLLLATGMLRHVVVFAFDENVFGDAITTSCILLCANDGNSGSVKFTKIGKAGHLDEIGKLIDTYPRICGDGTFPAEALDSAVKWRRYYEEQASARYRHLVPFSTYAKVTRGIATGANAFFTFNATKARARGIGHEHLLPCVCHATDVKGHIFKASDYEALLREDKHVMLLNARDTANAAVAAYIADGERQGIQHRYLTSCRKPWYATERRAPSPIWVSVFNRTGLRFVRNETGVANLTTFHCVYPAAGLYAVDTDLLFAYLLTDTARDIFRDNAREYGNGLQKFEPNDLNRGMMLDISLLSTQAKANIIEEYHKYTASGDNTYIVEIDRVIEREFLL